MNRLSSVNLTATCGAAAGTEEQPLFAWPAQGGLWALESRAGRAGPVTPGKVVAEEEEGRNAAMISGKAEKKSD